MSQPPPPYERSFSFTDHSVNTPDLQQPGQKIDQELNNVLSTVNQTISRLGEIQRDDGKLRDEFVAEAVAGAVASAEAERLMAQAARLDTYAARTEVLAAETHVVAIADGLEALAGQTLLDAQAAAQSAEDDAQASALSASASSASAASSSSSASDAHDSELAAAASATSASGSASASAISAASANDAKVAAQAAQTATEAVVLNSVRFDSPQSLTAGQKTQARDNISAQEAGDYATNTALTSGLAGKAALVHTHVVGDVTGLQTSLDGKLDEPAVAGVDGQILSTNGVNPVWVDNAARTLFSAVRNETGATLVKGTVVYINGASGNKATVAKAQANGDATSATTFAVLSADIANNNNGTAIVVGELTGLDTSAYAEGAALYLSPTVAGGFTTTKPHAPNHIVYVATVTRSHANQGIIEVRIQNGYELDELHNVQAQAPNDGDGIFFDDADDQWKTASVVSKVPSASTTTEGKVELATMAETDSKSSTTLAVTPNGLRDFMVAPQWNSPDLSGSTAVTATGTTNVGSAGIRLGVSSSGSASGQYAVRYFGNSSNATIPNFLMRGESFCSLDKRILLAARLKITGLVTNAVHRLTFGKLSSGAVGNLSDKGFGLRIIGTGAAELQVHNGTTLTNVTSSFTPSTQIAFDVIVENVGDGNVNLYINDSLVATSSAGGTGDYTSTTIPTIWQEIELTGAIVSNTQFHLGNLYLGTID